jgi:ATP-dependent DNA helicase RecG
MPRIESQQLEWKEVWRDEFLRGICGFANASGGILQIGKNYKGEIVGLPNAAKLLEDLPNKIRDVLGILVEVNLQQESGAEFLEIKV